MNQNWDFTQAGSLSDVYSIDVQGLDALNQDMIDPVQKNCLKTMNL